MYALILWLLNIYILSYWWKVNYKDLDKTAILNSSNDFNPRLAKCPLVFNGRLANSWLTSLVKGAIGVWRCQAIILSYAIFMMAVNNLSCTTISSFYVFFFQAYDCSQGETVPGLPASASMVNLSPTHLHQVLEYRFMYSSVDPVDIHTCYYTWRNWRLDICLIAVCHLAQPGTVGT